jgi:hypothetical protein
MFAPVSGFTRTAMEIFKMIRFSTLRKSLLSLVLLAGAALSLLPGSAVAIAIVQSASNTNAGSASTTLSVSFSSPPTPGNAVIVVWSSRELNNLTGLADNQAGNTYSSVVIETSSANGVDSEIWWEPAVVGSSGTFTVTGTSSASDEFVVTIVEVSGLSGVVDRTRAQGATNDTETLTATATAANTNANDLVIANMATGFTNTAIGISSPANTGYTSLNLQNGTGAYNGVVQTSFKIVTAIETSSANWTSTTAFNGAAGTLATFKGTAPVVPSNFSFFGVGD